MIMSNSDVIKDIMDFVVLINENTDACVFARYEGHVNILNVEVYTDGKWENSQPMIKDSIECTQDYARRRLLHLKDDLKELWLTVINSKGVK